MSTLLSSFRSAFGFQKVSLGTVKKASVRWLRSAGCFQYPEMPGQRMRRRKSKAPPKRPLNSSDSAPGSGTGGLGASGLKK